MLRTKGLLWVLPHMHLVEFQRHEPASQQRCSNAAAGLERPSLLVAEQALGKQLTFCPLQQLPECPGPPLQVFCNLPQRRASLAESLGGHDTPPSRNMSLLQSQERPSNRASQEEEEGPGLPSAGCFSLPLSLRLCSPSNSRLLPYGPQ